MTTIGRIVAGWIIISLTALPSAGAAPIVLYSPLPHSGLRVVVSDAGNVGMSLFEKCEPSCADPYGSPTEHQILHPLGAFNAASGLEFTFRVDGVSFGNGFQGDTNDPSFVGIFPTSAKRIDNTSASFDWNVREVRALLNVTLVENSTLFHWWVTNQGSVPHDFGLRHSLDLYLANVHNDASRSTSWYEGLHSKPWVHVPGRPGDVNPPAYPGVHRNREQRFSDVDFDQVKVWESPTGPDNAGGRKANLWWDKEWGGTPPDEVVLGSFKALQYPWAYPVEGNPIEADSFLMLYWGHDQPWRLAPRESRHIYWWYGRDAPPKLESFWIDANWLSLKPGEGKTSSRLALTEAGASAYFPFEIRSKGLLAHQAKEDKVRLALQVEQSMPGWTAEVVQASNDEPFGNPFQARTGVPMAGRIKITAPPDAAGSDAFAVRLVAIMEGIPPQVDSSRSKTISTLRAVGMVRAETGLTLTPLDDPALALAAGESGSWRFTLSNHGNLREPLRIRLHASAVSDEPWEFQFVPSEVVSIAAGETVQAALQVRPSLAADPGSTEVLVQAKDSFTGDSAAGALEVRVLQSDQLSLKVDQQGVGIAPGGTRVIIVQILNRGADRAAFSLQVGSGGPAGDWRVSHSLSGLSADGLPPGGRAQLAIEIAAGKAARAGDRLEVPIRLLNPSATRQFVNTTLAATVTQAVDVEFEAPEGPLFLSPGETQTLQLRIKNRGNTLDTFALEPFEGPPDLLVERQAASLHLTPGQTGIANLTLTVRPDASSGSLTLGLRVRSLSPNAGVPLEHKLDIEIEESRGAKVEWERLHQVVLPGSSVTLRGTLKNLGNTPQTFTLAGTPPSWTLRDHPRLLNASEEATLSLDLTVPSNTPPGVYSFELTPHAAAGPIVVTSGTFPRLTVVVGDVDLVIEALELDPATPIAGQTVVATVILRNLGSATSAAFDVVVQLDGSEVLPRGRIEAVGPNHTAQLRFTWIANGNSHEIRTTVDPKDENADKDPTNNQRTLLVPSDSATAKSFVHAVESSSSATTLLTTILLAALPTLQRRRR